MISKENLANLTFLKLNMSAVQHKQQSRVGPGKCQRMHSATMCVFSQCAFSLKDPKRPHFIGNDKFMNFMQIIPPTLV